MTVWAIYVVIEVHHSFGKMTFCVYRRATYICCRSGPVNNTGSCGTAAFSRQRTPRYPDRSTISGILIAYRERRSSSAHASTASLVNSIQKIKGEEVAVCRHTQSISIECILPKASPPQNDYFQRHHKQQSPRRHGTQ